MQAQSDWSQLAGVFLPALFVVALVWFGIVALRQARRRRRLEMQESPADEIDSPVARSLQRRSDARAGAQVAPAPSAEASAPSAVALVSAGATEASAAAKAASSRAPKPDSTLAPAPKAASVSTPEPVSTLDVPGPVASSGGASPAGPADAALTRGLSRTASALRERLGQIFARHDKIDPHVIGELEEALLSADVGVAMTTRLLQAVRDSLQASRLKSGADVRHLLAEHMLAAFAASDAAAARDPLLTEAGGKPRVILFVGVNGVGKTTTIGKIAAQARARGLDVVLAAGDTFRAAAVEQLSVWAERTHSRVIRGETGVDPASVVFNAITHAVQTNADLVLADTAGRLHTKTLLMDEIKKIKRSVGKARIGAPDETWLVVDATTGQNALHQAREFHQALTLTGVILTKLDGTAKGGVVVAIADALHLPVRYVGVGEQPEDLRPFAPHDFVTTLFA